MAPVFSLIMDEDVNDEIAFRFPELYGELQLVIFKLNMKIDNI